MRIFAQWALVFILAAILFLYIQGEAADKQTSRLYARAHLSEVQNEARKDMGIIFLPYVVISVSLIGGALVVVALTYGLIALATIWINRPQVTRPTHTIETRTIETRILVLQPGVHSKRKIFQLLSGERK